MSSSKRSSHFRTPHSIGVLRFVAGLKADAQAGENVIPMRAKQTLLPTDFDDLPITGKTFLRTLDKDYDGNCETSLKIHYMRNRRLARKAAARNQ